MDAARYTAAAVEAATGVRPEIFAFGWMVRENWFTLSLSLYVCRIVCVWLSLFSLYVCRIVCVCVCVGGGGCRANDDFRAHEQLWIWLMYAGLLPSE